MLVSALAFLAVINLVGFTLLPYIVGKEHPLSRFLPLHVFHKYFVLIQLGLYNILVSHFQPANINLYIVLMIVSLVAITDLFFGWKWFVRELLFGDGVDPLVYQTPCVNIMFDVDCFINHKYEMKHDFSGNVFVSQDSRIMADLINFSLSVLLINLFM